MTIIVTPQGLVVPQGQPQRPFVSLTARGAGWSSTVPRTGSTYPWTSRSTHLELGFRTFRPMRVILGEIPSLRDSDH